MGGDIEELLIAQHTPPWDVALLGLLLAPSGQGAQYRQVSAVGRACLQTTPRQFRVQAIGLRRRENGHLLFQPGGAAGFGQPALELAVDLSQMGDISQSVIQLALRQRPARPVGKAG